MSSSKISLGITLCLLSTVTLAEQFATQQVSGFYHQPLGKFQVTALFDGDNRLPATVFQGQETAQIQSFFDQNYVKTDSGVQTSVNAFLINTGDKLILIDSGAAQCFGDALGSIEKNLNAAGYQSSQIDAVLLTHLHPDHSCGISAIAGQKSFPKATVYVNQQEADFWLNNDNLNKLSEAEQKRFSAAFEKSQAAVKPYQSSKQFKTYNIGDQIFDSIRIIPTYGHTIGHTSYLVESGQDKLLVLGDVVHNHLLQFQHPEVSFVFDYNSAQAVATRKDQFTQAAKGGYLVVAAHLPFPGIGHIKQSNQEQFTWLPVQYNPIVVPENK